MQYIFMVMYICLKHSRFRQRKPKRSCFFFQFLTKIIYIYSIQVKCNICRGVCIQYTHFISVNIFFSFLSFSRVSKFYYFSFLHCSILLPLITLTTFRQEKKNHIEINNVDCFFLSILYQFHSIIKLPFNLLIHLLEQSINLQRFLLRFIFYVAGVRTKSILSQTFDETRCTTDFDRFPLKSQKT